VQGTARDDRQRRRHLGQGNGAERAAGDAVQHDPATAVSTVRFANASDGWLFNPGLWQTTDGGRQWRKTFHEQGKPSEAGQMYQLAMVPGNPKVLTLEAASGATFLDRSVNGGKTWTQATFDDGGTGMRDLAYFTTSK
jgi:photosystem II stability/assembly factor-like uncharacterized protein